MVSRSCSQGALRFRFSRRTLIRGSLAVGGLALLSACGSGAAATAPPPPAATTAPATVVQVPTAAPSSTPTTAAVAKPIASSTAAKSPPQGVGVTLIALYLTTDNVEQDAIWPRVLTKFEQENSSIKLKASGGVSMKKLTTLLASGTPPDWVYSGGSIVPDLGYKGVLLDLTPYLARDKIDVASFWSGGWTYCTIRGKRVALPNNIDPQLLFYDKSLFQSAGVRTPLALEQEGKWTWQQFRQAALRLTKRSAGSTGPQQLANVYGFELPLSLEWSLPWFRTWGGEILNADLTAPTLQTPGMIAAVNALRALSVQDRSAFPPGLPKAPSFIAMEKAGREAMVWAWDSRIAIWRDVHYDWDVVGTVPAAKNDPQSLLGGDAIFLFTSSKHKDAGWTLARWCITPGLNLEIATAYGSVPGLRQNLNPFEAALRKQGRPVNVSAFGEALKVAQPRPPTPAFHDLQNAWGAAINPVWLGQASPESVLGSLTTQFTAILAKYR